MKNSETDMTITKVEATPYDGQTNQTLLNKRIELADDKRKDQGISTTFFPRDLLTLPIWYGPSSSAKIMATERHINFTRNYRKHILTVETLNPIGQGNPGSGRLTYLDLDVSMALSYLSFVRKNQHIDVAHSDLLNWMAYKPDAAPALAILQGSIDRMANTSIRWYERLDSHIFGDDYDTKTVKQNMDAKQVRILNGPTIHSTERSRRFELSMSDEWIQMLESGSFQEIDLDAYAHLLQNYKKHGAIRHLYCFLTAFRDRSTKSFSVPWGTINSRLGSYNLSSGRIRNIKPTERSNVVKQLRLLETAGLIKIDGEAYMNGMIAGEFDYSKVKRLARREVQTTFLPAQEWESPSLQTPPKEDIIKDDIDESKELQECRRKIRFPLTEQQKLMAIGWNQEQLINLYSLALQKAQSNPRSYTLRLAQDGEPEMYDNKYWGKPSKSSGKMHEESRHNETTVDHPTYDKNLQLPPDKEQECVLDINFLCEEVGLPISKYLTRAKIISQESKLVAIVAPLIYYSIRKHDIEPLLNHPDCPISSIEGGVLQ